MHRYKFVLYRPIQFLPVLFGISVVTFVLVRLIPGDPAATIFASARALFGLEQAISLVVA